MSQQELHLDTLFNVLEFLGMRDGFSCMLVCKHWHQLDRFEMVWKTLLSNWVLLNIDNYEKRLIESNGVKGLEKIYKTLIVQSRKFYTTQIVNEKKVNRVSFLQFMDDDCNDPNEKSSVYGSRFKNLIPSALNSNFSIVMNKGLDEMNEYWQSSIIDYKHNGHLAQMFLDNARKFSEKGRSFDTVKEREYWRRFPHVLLDYALFNSEKNIVQLVKNFKPIFNDGTLTNLICLYKGNEWDFLLKYICVEENYTKSENTLKTYTGIMGVIHSHDLSVLERWFECFDLIYPGLSLKILDNFCYQSNRLVGMSLVKDIEYVKKYCRIVKVTKIDLFSGCVLENMLRNGKGYKLINELLNCGLIDINDIRRILHEYNFLQKNAMKSIVWLQDFDPYEVITNERTCNFVDGFLACGFPSVSTFFENYFEIYGLYDLNKLIENMNNQGRSVDLRHYEDLINKRLLDQFVDWRGNENSIKSADILINYFKPSCTGVSSIERICQILKGIPNISKTKIDTFQFIMDNVHCNGMSFSEFCKEFYTKYSDCGLDAEFENCVEGSEERMAKLYYLCINIIGASASPNE